MNNSRVIVMYDPHARMGNRMFMYAFGKILAAHKQCTFFAEKLPYFFPTWTTPLCFGLHDHHLLEPTFRNPLFLRKTFGNQWVNYTQLLDHDGDIIVDSFLQKATYYTQYREEIRKWFKFAVPPDPQLPESTEIVLHVRETDYVTLGIMPPIEYYTNLLKGQEDRKKTIITDNPYAPYLEPLTKMGCQIYSGLGPNQLNGQVSESVVMRDFLYMMYADTLLMSQSSFCWWAAFLGGRINQWRTIYCPLSRNAKAMWKSNPELDDIDLCIPEFKKVEY